MWKNGKDIRPDREIKIRFFFFFRRIKRYNDIKWAINLDEGNGDKKQALKELKINIISSFVQTWNYFSIRETKHTSWQRNQAKRPDIEINNARLLWQTSERARMWSKIANTTDGEQLSIERSREQKKRRRANNDVKENNLYYTIGV